MSPSPGEARDHRSEGEQPRRAAQRPGCRFRRRQTRRDIGGGGGVGGVVVVVVVVVAVTLVVVVVVEVGGTVVTMAIVEDVDVGGTVVVVDVVVGGTVVVVLGGAGTTVTTNSAGPAIARRCEPGATRAIPAPGASRWARTSPGGGSNATTPSAAVTTSAAHPLGCEVHADAGDRAAGAVQAHAPGPWGQRPRAAARERLDVQRLDRLLDGDEVADAERRTSAGPSRHTAPPPRR